jgi:ketosteroid isomerase-like protein
MTMREIAAELVAGCREGREGANLDRLYAPDAVSVEAVDMGQGRETRGVDGIRAKHDWWDGAVEVHSQVVSDPMPHGEDRFAVIFEVDSTMKETGERTQMREVGIYTVADGRIVREEFFYPNG